MSGYVAPVPAQPKGRLGRFVALWSVLTLVVGAATFGLVYAASGSIGNSGGDGDVSVEAVANVPTATPTQAPPPTEVPDAGGGASQDAPPPAQEDPATATPVPTILPPEISGTLPADFELGAHFNGDWNDQNALNNMLVGKMQWLKIQLRHAPGMNPDDWGWQVQVANEAGFWILWGVVGEPEYLLEPGYMDEYAEFVGHLAKIGSNGIEVWNEVNIAREWPQGRIDPVMYTELLRKSYNAIKAENPDTLVISAGLAPTGAEGAFGLDNVWNDDRYYRGMAEAGAADYMDCVGAHYNEGIISPTRNSGDPRDTDYPTRYLEANTERAWAPFGGAVPVCYTELGYLTGEGYGALPGGFAWANNVTLANQAQWLGTAALINAQSGKVRMMVIWNLNFKNFDEDPMAGYAIIRPGGGCPACDTLGSLR